MIPVHKTGNIFLFSAISLIFSLNCALRLFWLWRGRGGSRYKTKNNKPPEDGKGRLGIYRRFPSEMKRQERKQHSADGPSDGNASLPDAHGQASFPF